MPENNNYIRLLEALLFASGEPMSTFQLHERMPEGADVGGLLMDLQAHYAPRGIHLIDTQGQWAFRTALDLKDELNIEKQISKKLSRAAMETLAIIAYHQPVTRSEIENIRGVATHKGTLDTLLEMGWIKPGRRRETLGRPLTWVSTAGFLDHFSLESIVDLPGMDEMKASGLLDRRPAIDTIHQDDLFTGQSAQEGVESDTQADETSPEELIEGH
ncbi:MAG: SMC-Scp complex subunit ScpB [Zetaproteobacteria bacterium]|nr:MAG: SMC-Scp complex subunit ScpB [Zetaproteobacteria bacterium]